MEIIRSIHSRIYEIRGVRVMIDKDLAAMYETETKVLNLAVKRNLMRFPPDFMFQLTESEYNRLRFQIETLEDSANSVDLKQIKKGRGQYSKYLPYAFTEQGIAMLSGVLKSEKAIVMNIAIMRTFVAVRETFLKTSDVNTQLDELKGKIEIHDNRLSQIYDVLENLIDEKSIERKWEDRERIGFRNDK